MNMQISIGASVDSDSHDCPICTVPYDATTHAPFRICSRAHTICAYCVGQLENKPDCPFCREPIDFRDVVINNDIYSTLPEAEVQPNVRN
jgi:predicted amidophosphoribosyltransferase